MTTRPAAHTRTPEANQAAAGNGRTVCVVVAGSHRFPPLSEPLDMKVLNGTILASRQTPGPDVLLWLGSPDPRAPLRYRDARPIEALDPVVEADASLRCVVLSAETARKAHAAAADPGAGDLLRRILYGEACWSAVRVYVIAPLRRTHGRWWAFGWRHGRRPGEGGGPLGFDLLHLLRCICPAPGQASACQVQFWTPGDAPPDRGAGAGASADTADDGGGSDAVGPQKCASLDYPDAEELDAFRAELISGRGGAGGGPPSIPELSCEPLYWETLSREHRTQVEDGKERWRQTEGKQPGFAELERLCRSPEAARDIPGIGRLPAGGVLLVHGDNDPAGETWAVRLGAQLQAAGAEPVNRVPAGLRAGAVPGEKPHLVVLLADLPVVVLHHLLRPLQPLAGEPPVLLCLFHTPDAQDPWQAWRPPPGCGATPGLSPLFWQTKLCLGLLGGHTDISHAAPPPGPQHGRADIEALKAAAAALQSGALHDVLEALASTAARARETRRRFVSGERLLDERTRYLDGLERGLAELCTDEAAHTEGQPEAAALAGLWQVWRRQVDAMLGRGGAWWAFPREEKETRTLRVTLSIPEGVRALPGPAGRGAPQRYPECTVAYEVERGATGSAPEGTGRSVVRSVPLPWTRAPMIKTIRDALLEADSERDPRGYDPRRDGQYRRPPPRVCEAVRQGQQAWCHCLTRGGDHPQDPDTQEGFIAAVRAFIAATSGPDAPVRRVRLTAPEPLVHLPLELLLTAPEAVTAGSGPLPACRRAEDHDGDLCLDEPIHGTRAGCIVRHLPPGRDTLSPEAEDDSRCGGSVLLVSFSPPGNHVSLGPHEATLANLSRAAPGDAGRGWPVFHPEVIEADASVENLFHDIADKMRELRDQGRPVRVLHIVAQGAQSGLVLGAEPSQGPNARPQQRAVAASQLRGLLDAPEGSGVRLVMLQVCKSAVRQVAMHEAHLPSEASRSLAEACAGPRRHVIAAQFLLDVEAAATMTRVFYESLVAHRRSVETAFALGCEAIHREFRQQSYDWASFVLYAPTEP